MQHSKSYFSTSSKFLGSQFFLIRRHILCVILKLKTVQKQYTLNNTITFSVFYIFCCFSELYSSVWEQVARLVSPLPPQDRAQHNHATDCDDSLG